jgi:predicted TPR repeat methyltransferase
MADALEQARNAFFEGVALFEQGQLQPAEAAFERALSLAPGRPSVLLNLGITRFELGRFADALAPLQQSLKAEPAAPDGWLALARCHMRLGQLQESIHSFQTLLEQQPDNGLAWQELGECFRLVESFDQAAHAYQQAIAHGNDTDYTQFLLAAVTQQGVVPQPPSSYVQALFDDYAADFESHLVGTLGYQGHQAVVHHLPGNGQQPLGHVLDLGCGTGLCGQLVRPRANRLVGVDLAPQMVEQAQATGLYDELWTGDLHDRLAESNHTFDTVLAADVLIYVGALERLFALLAQRMKAGGVWSFSVEAGAPGSGVQLLTSLRYSHAPDYIQSLAKQHGFSVLGQHTTPIRHDQRQPVMGDFWVLQRED